MNRIAVERKLKDDMTQAELAKTVGVSRATVIRWEGGAPIHQEKLIELCGIFKCNLDWLVGLSDNRQSTVEQKVS